jgi:Ca-activated chloride channel family protein
VKEKEERFNVKNCTWKQNMVVLANAIFVFLFFSTHCLAVPGEATRKIKEANGLFQQEKYEEALTKYNDAQIDLPNSAEVHFNIGDSLYRMGKYDEAVASFEKAAEFGDVDLEAKTYYNIGNCLFRQGRLQEALESYRRALELNPDDLDAKFNIEFTERKIKEMLSQASQTEKKAVQEQERRQQTSQSPQAEGQQKEEEERDAESEAARQPQPQEDTQSLQEKEQESQEGKNEKGKSPSSEPKEELSKEDAERILSSLEEEATHTTQQLPRKGYEYEVEKDW